MPTAQLLATVNGGLQFEESGTDPFFYNARLIPSNCATLTNTSTLSWLMGFNNGNLTVKISPTDYINNVPISRNVGNSGQRGIFYESSNAGTGEVQRWIYQHRASNTGTNARILTAGQEFLLLVSGRSTDLNSLPTNYDGLSIVANDTAYFITGVAAGTGVFRDIIIRRGATGGFRVAASSIAPVSTMDLGTAANPWTNVYIGEIQWNEDEQPVVRASNGRLKVAHNAANGTFDVSNISQLVIVNGLITQVIEY
jgi:hypothetical protein